MRWQYPDQLEADFQQYYHLDIADVKPARAARLLFQLPQGCRVYAAIEPATQWGFFENFQNRMVFLLETIVWQNGYDPKKKALHKAKQPKLFVPDFLKRPGIDKDKVAADIDDIKVLLSRRRKAAETTPPLEKP